MTGCSAEVNYKISVNELDICTHTQQTIVCIGLNVEIIQVEDKSRILPILLVWYASNFFVIFQVAQLDGKSSKIIKHFIGLQKG